MANKNLNGLFIPNAVLLDFQGWIQKGFISLELTQTWIKILIASSLSFIAFAFIRFRNSREIIKYKYQLEKQYAINIERERIARDIHDDLGSGLSAIHLLSNYLKENAEAKYPEFSTEVEKILKSSAELNQRIREIIWTINSKDDSLNSLVLFVRRYCHELKEQLAASIEVHSQDPIPELQLSGEQRKQVFLCIKEAINNALKHGKPTEIELDIASSDLNIITIQICDNGSGFDVEQSTFKNGNGLNNLKLRMTDIEGTAEIVSDHNGNRLNLKFPAIATS